MDIKTSLIKSLHKSLEENNPELTAQIELKLAQQYYNESNYSMSKSHLQHILNKYDSYPNVNYYLGLCELNLDNDEQAIKHLKKEIKINPKHEFAKEILSKFTINSNFPITTILLLLLSIITFIFSTNSYETLLKFGASTYNLTFYSLFTSIFFHANLYHLIFNSIFLIMFGLYLEKYIGSIKYLIIFLIGGIIGNLMQVMLSETGFIIGMSSGIFAIFGAIVAREPLLNFKLFGIINTPLIILFGIVFVSQYILGATVQIENLLFGEIAHLFGFIIGLFIMVLYNQDLIFIFYNWLIISIGFFLCAYGATEIIQNIIILNATKTILPTIIFVFGFLLITYSYYKLKFDITKINDTSAEENLK